MMQLLRALAVLPQDPGWTPSTYIVATPVQGTQCPLLASRQPEEHLSTDVSCSRRVEQRGQFIICSPRWNCCPS
ncbi:hypothetical protein LEMLEM_LOCUS5236 [Lemmus lemmus]